ncbi:MAG: septal ring lytic transglycosylase RlpA family protein [Gammaproteobacteria bacterium]|nr:septal ring lytic transglycosylase RlpA family protein [Gammaproteobacteria bacterium]
MSAKPSPFEKEGLRGILKLSYLLLFIAFLSACSTMHHDGPPSFPVDASKISDAKPKVEPLSKYGNRNYEVYGQYYHVLSSSRHFKQRGIASWYGTQFDSHKTSSGERYNMLAMTAAHKTLPLPTYVRVTNLKNGRRIIVKVNDRGPFAPGRIIDLSYVAAKKLGMLAHGTAYVDIEAIDPTHYDSAKPIRDNHHPVWLASAKRTHHHVIYLQLGAFSQRHFAERLQKKLNHLLSSPVQITRRSNHHNLYHVEIGPIHDTVTANRIRKQLKMSGLDSHLIQHQAEG